MIEEQENEEIFRYIVLVDGAAHVKAYHMEGVINAIRDIQGITNDPVEVHTIH